MNCRLYTRVMHKSWDGPDIPNTCKYITRERERGVCVCVCVCTHVYVWQLVSYYDVIVHNNMVSDHIIIYVHKHNYAHLLKCV